ncbi:MAG: hypothetical protein ACTJHU_02555 [Mycetocola sp.]
MCVALLPNRRSGSPTRHPSGLRSHCPSRTPFAPLGAILSILLGYDAVTLRETVDERLARERLDELGAQRSLAAICEKTWLLKVLDQLEDAIDHANQAVRLARFTGVRRDQLQPRILRATVMQARGEHPTAAHELTLCADDARTNQWRQLEAVALQHRGRGSFEMREYPAAVDDFLAALRIREDAGVGQDQIETSRFALEVARSFATTGGPITLMRRPAAPTTPFDGAAEDAGSAPRTAPTSRSARRADSEARQRSEQSSRRHAAHTDSIPLIGLDEVDAERHPAPEPIFARFRRRAVDNGTAVPAGSTETADSSASATGQSPAPLSDPGSTATASAPAGQPDTVPTEPPASESTADTAAAVPVSHDAQTPVSSGSTENAPDDQSQDPSSISGADASATLWASAARTAGEPVVPRGVQTPDAEQGTDNTAAPTPDATDAEVAPTPVTASRVSQTLHAETGVPKGRKQRRDHLWGRFNAASTRRDEE